MASFRDFTGAEAGVAAVGWAGAAVPILTFPRTARRTGQFGIKSLKTTPSIGGSYRFDFVPTLGPIVPGADDLVGQFHFWVRFNAFPSADGHPVGGWVFGINVSQIAGLYVNSSSTDTAAIGMGMTGFSKSLGTVTKNRWYRVEVDTLIHNDTGAAALDFARVTVRVHGDEVGTATDQTTSIGTFTAVRVAVGGFNVAGPSASIDMDFDDLVFEVRDDGVAFSIPKGAVVAPVPVDVVDEPQSIGQTGDRDDIDERPFDATDPDFVSIPANGDQVIIHHRAMCVRNVSAWKASLMVRGTAGTHAILISGVEFPVTVAAPFLFREATRFADLTEAEFNDDTIGLRNKLGTSLDLNAIVGEILCTRAEALLTPEDAVRGSTIPMTWVEFVDSDATMHVWGAQDVAAPTGQPTLPVGDVPRTEVEFQEGRVIGFGSVQRGLSDFGGEPEDVSFGWTLNDSDREIRKLLRAEATRCFIGRDVQERVFTVRDRFLEIKPFTLGRGVVERYNPKSPLQFEFEATGAVLRTDRSGRNRAQIPKRRISSAFFPDCPEDNLDGPEPIVYGALSSFPPEPEAGVAAVASVPGAVANVAAKGVANAGTAPVGLAASTAAPAYQHTILTYTGDGTAARPITGAGFRPDVVFIKAHNGGSGFASVFRTADHTGTNSQDWNGGLIASGGIESLDVDGFTVGTNTRVNQTGVIYVVLAISKADETLFRHGTYVGDGVDDRSITIVAGFQPSYLFVKNESASPAVFRGLDHVGDESTVLASSAQTTDLVQAFEVNGFQVGTQVNVNQTGVTHYFFAWRNLAGALDAFFETGTYTGTGAGQTISGLAFQPVWVMQRPQASGNDASWRHTSHPASNGSTWGASSNDTFRITAFTGDGFTVNFLGSILGATHHFFAIGSGSVSISGGGLTPVNQAVERFYRISAVVGGVETKLSLIVSATTSPTGRQIEITWTVVAGATAINVYSSNRQDFKQFAVSVLAGGATVFTDTDVPRNQTREQLGNVASDARTLGVRESVKYVVYAQLAGGRFSRPGEAILDALVDGDDISADKTSFAPLNGDRRALLTWDAFTGAVGYSIFRWTAFHSDDRAQFDQRTDVDALTLSLSDTLVFGRERVPVLLPSGEAGTDPKGRDNIGLVPLVHVGTEVISGTRFQRLLVAGHACKEVQAIFRTRGDDAGADLDPGGDRADADTFLQVTDAEIGVSWLLPGKTAWPFADDFRDITDADGNTRRYTLVYTTEDPVPEQVLANVLGVEDVGDTTGALVQRVLQQFKHCSANFLLGNYQSGGYGVTPTFRLDGEEQIDLDSFDDADAQTALRIDGGYIGAGMLGNGGEFKSIRTILAEFAQSCDVDVGINHVGQLFVSILTEFADLSATRIYSDGSGGQGGDMQADSFQVLDVQDRQFNRVIYRYMVRFAETRNRGSGKFERQSDHEEAIEDQDSIDCFGDVIESPPLVFRFIRDSAIANDIARRYLSRVKDPPRRVFWKANISGTSTEIGDIVRVTHPHGVGEFGWTKNPVRVVRHSVDMTSYEVEFEGWDVFRLFFETFILGDETLLPAAFTAATPDEQLFGYLCDEVTGQFSDGTTGKRLR